MELKGLRPRTSVVEEKSEINKEVVDLDLFMIIIISIAIDVRADRICPHFPNVF